MCFAAHIIALHHARILQPKTSSYTHIVQVEAINPARIVFHLNIKTFSESLVPGVCVSYDLDTFISVYKDIGPETVQTYIFDYSDFTIVLPLPY